MQHVRGGQRDAHARAQRPDRPVGTIRGQRIRGPVELGRVEAGAHQHASPSRAVRAGHVVLDIGYESRQLRPEDFNDVFDFAEFDDYRIEI